MNPQFNLLQQQTRRHFLRGAGQLSLGAIALDALLGTKASGAQGVAPQGAAGPPHGPAKVKRIVYLHMSGAPPHLDIFDYKPELVKRSGQDSPDQFVKGKTFAFTSGTP